MDNNIKRLEIQVDAASETMGMLRLQANLLKEMSGLSRESYLIVSSIVSRASDATTEEIKAKEQARLDKLKEKEAA